MKLSVFFAVAFLIPLSLHAYDPFSRPAYLTSSFGESRGTRYHAGIDYSTNMEEGWPVLAPESGYVAQIRTSPFSYGRVLFFKGASGRTWVFAHQSGFCARIDSAVYAAEYKSRHNDIVLDSPATAPFRTGDTLTFTGSTGIGNPHLHLEIRLGGDTVISPCGSGITCYDTLPPQILGAFAWYKNHIRLTGDSALARGCLAVPGKSQNYFAFKIADYSRTPLDNPMSVRRVTLYAGKKKLFEHFSDTLNFNKMINIREELLWAEEADTAGDWHYIPIPVTAKKLRLETEDFVGHVTALDLETKKDCRDSAQMKPLMFGKHQDSTLFTFNSRAFLNLSQCGAHKFKAGDDKKILVKDLCKAFPHEPVALAAITNKYPKVTRIRMYMGDSALKIAEVQDSIAMNSAAKDTAQENPAAITADSLKAAERARDRAAIERDIYISKPFKKGKFKFEVNFEGNGKITQTITGAKPQKYPQVLAVMRLKNDSVPAFEFHPKGLHFTGDWTVCIDSSLAPDPLYYLGETTRRWNPFGKHCATTNELRDVGSIKDTVPPALGKPYFGRGMFYGHWEETLRIPVIEKYSGIPDGNAVSAFDKDGNWIGDEYDSEPRELVFERSRLPAAGGNFTVQIKDEAGNAAKLQVTVPDDKGFVCKDCVTPQK